MFDRASREMKILEDMNDRLGDAHWGIGESLNDAIDLLEYVGENEHISFVIDKLTDSINNLDKIDSVMRKIADTVRQS